MKLSTTINDFARFGLSLPEAIRYLGNTPFKYADFAFLRDTTDDRWESTAARCAEAAAECGITFVQAHGVDINPLQKDPKAALLTAERTLAICAKLGIPHVVFHALFCSDECYPNGREHFFEQNRKFYSMLLPMAEHYGVTVLAENSVELHSGGCYYLMTGEDLRDFVDFVDHPFMGAVWDVGHANIRKNDQYKDIVALGDRLKVVHIHDNFGERDEHLAPFLGNTDFDSVLRGLAAIDFRGFFSFEADKCPPLRQGTPTSPTPALQLSYEQALYQTGKTMLETYGLFEQ